MTYVPNSPAWVDDDGSGTTGTPFTAARMNHIEQGISDAAALVGWTAVAATQSTNANIAAATLTLDGGVSLPVYNHRVLLLGQTNPAENGLYDYTVGFSTTTLTRTADADESAEFVQGREVFVIAGPYADQRLVYVGPSNPNVGVDPITFHAVNSGSKAFAFLMAA